MRVKRDKPTVFNYAEYEKAQQEIRRLRNQLANVEIKNRIAVSDILEQVKADMCDEFCKWPCLLKGEPEDTLLDICARCPLERL